VLTLHASNSIAVGSIVEGIIHAYTDIYSYSRVECHCVVMYVAITGQNNDCDGSAHGSSSMNAAYPQSSRTSNDHTSASAVGCTVEHNACVWRPLDIKSSLAANFNRVRYQGGQNYIIADKMLVMHQRESRCVTAMCLNNLPCYSLQVFASVVYL
jgi:hypothetical protein